ncbi:hypothetical protein BBK82_31045 [Lentzea guizhouensis]|uniref:Uncharacterized protein n=1 Tax=Lentzea guizhouensis TaxID=1586287 RepID=A0A1B2HQ37_9PSEU|nr:hypothetical protein [Lentzea guizhouensis]ANZ39823.1 hypothetical protein BBK82_31045 [Lentzea guizhouensis]
MTLKAPISSASYETMVVSASAALPSGLGTRPAPQPSTCTRRERSLDLTAGSTEDVDGGEPPGSTR